MNIKQHIFRQVQSPWYWMVYIVTGLTMLGTALVFQHAFDELPCVMCIQIRLWISLLVVVSIVGLLIRQQKWLNIIANMSTVVIFAGLTERSYQLLGTEKGFVFGDCGFNLGMPSWFAIDDWLPGLYRVETSCGYTPEVIFGITMAEALMVISVCFLLISICILIMSAIKATNKK